MIVLAVNSCISREFNEKDFYIRTVNRPQDLLGLNILAILHISKTDSNDLIRDAECRMNARNKVSSILLDDLTWSRK